jgi:nucleotide-binding universal stress UspA family protein
MKVKPTKHTGEVVLEVNRGDEPLLASGATAPFRLKKILVPIDFSDCSKKALQYALPLANQHAASLTLLYVVPTVSYAAGEYGGIDYVPIEADMRANAEKELAKLAVDEVRNTVDTETIVRTGSPGRVIVEAAKSLPADMIVISTHGRTGFKHVFLGSVAEDVVRQAPCAVLVVREQEREFLSK